MAISVKRISLFCDSSDYEFYQRLADRNDQRPEEFPFRTMLDAFVAFACLGYYYNQYIPLGTGKDKEELTLASYFAEDQRLLTLLSLAYAKRKGISSNEGTVAVVSSLLSTTEIIPIVEGWANGGVKLVRNDIESGVHGPDLTLSLVRALSSYAREGV